MKIFPESSFFKERRAHALPSPADIRAINEGSGNASVTSFNCPPLVMIPWLGLVVKYSADVTIIKAQTQMMFIEGETLIARWGSLDEDERRAICEELRGYLKMIRSLEQDLYIGSLGNRPLNDIFLKNHPDLVGPFLGKNAVKQFHSSCGIEISCKTHVVFTHNDLLPPNIIISPGQSPKVAAIVDWAQAGWYPAYWEYCKAWW
ncbi:hypothetical protein KXV57_003962, partial [Aspergillus fumigatus]